MRKLAIAVALASTAISTPVVARDHSPYIGVDVGPMIVEHFQSDFRSPDLDVNNGVDFRHKVGFDVDVNAGYDFGPFRAEAELAYKRAGVREIGFREQLQNEQLGGYFNADGKVTTISGMINGLVDFGGDDGWSGFVGGGVGLA
ncbi:MAG TPA: flagellar motor protein MotB, partial [Sphingomicrobium sp.]|nr:flagellar motor protein MotB [Sphingomicrobium sp.]